MKPPKPIVGESYVMYQYNPESNRFRCMRYVYCALVQGLEIYQHRGGGFVEYTESVYEQWMFPIGCNEQAFESILNKYSPESFNSKVKEKYPEHFI